MSHTFPAFSWPRRSIWQEPVPKHSLLTAQPHGSASLFAHPAYPALPSSGLILLTGMQRVDDTFLAFPTSPSPMGQTLLGANSKL